MSISDRAAVFAALKPLQELLAADGYDIALDGLSGEKLVFGISAGPQACAECLVPKSIMSRYVRAQLEKSAFADLEFELLYPADRPTNG